MSDLTRLALADWLCSKWRQRLTDSGSAYFSVATQMRKQGMPIEIALALLLGRGLSR
jgi:hypothetical protein